MSDKGIDPREVGLDFLRAEVATGLRFAAIAADAGNDEKKRQRNRQHAETAYDALLRFLPRVALTEDETEELTGGIEELRRAIAAIRRP
jgi:hypothetical protein